ncbi:MAG TPA: CGNR zinc finger domain-containing protein [Actinomycetota bacterium]|nr:CGNR zinc finger domain-containing protein [Actinomycetota bacterium]
MDFTHYTDLCVHAAADLVNTQGSISGNEFLGTPEAVAEFLASHGFSETEGATPADMKEIHAVRDRLREVFLADDAKAAAELLNGILDELDVHPYLTDHDGVWHFHYVPTGASLAVRVAATTAMGLATVLSEFGFDRIGFCQAENCKDVFVDMSRNRSRRYCNEICSSRMNVAAYRARHKQKAAQ